MMKFAIATLGCKVNQYETEVLRENLKKLGFQETRSHVSDAAASLSADILIVNSCTVTAEADLKTKKIIRKAKKDNPDVKIFVTGCLAVLEEDIKNLQSMPEVYRIVPAKEKMNLPHMLMGKGDNVKDTQPVKEKIDSFEGHTRTFLKIQDGCPQACSYCKVRLARGVSRSKQKEHILDEVACLLQKGYKEIVLTGICLGDWKDKNNQCLADLVKSIERLEGFFRIRLSSIEPNYITEPLIEFMASSKKICRHLHIPLQSGSDKILKAMNRSYTSEGFEKLIASLREKIPLIGVSMDVMTGFPGESEDDFKKTVGLLKEIKPSRIHVFSYSDRKGTFAYGLKDKVPSVLAKQRTHVLIKLGEELAGQFSTRFVAKEVDVLAEKLIGSNLIEGYTSEYVRMKVNAAGCEKGKIIRAKAVFFDNENRCLLGESIPG